MNLYSSVTFPKFDQVINYNSELVFLGSCFTEEIGQWLEQLKFKTEINPFGISYNPISIAHQINSALERKGIASSNIQERDGLFFHPDVHSSLSRNSLNDFKEEVARREHSLRESLLTCDILFITLGTSIAFEWQTTNQIVNNCHQLPSTQFKKRMLSEEEINESLIDVFNKLIAKNPEVSIVLTVSPIRHLRHGAVQNQRSKARLIRSCENLEEKFTNCTYLPIYELVMDELRDYRFYRQDDLIHLNEGGLAMVKERFSDHLLSSSCSIVKTQIETWQKLFNHRIQYPKSEEAQKFTTNLIQKTEELNLILDGRFDVELKQLKTSNTDLHR